jgi:hypothetical protein
MTDGPKASDPKTVGASAVDGRRALRRPVRGGARAGRPHRRASRGPPCAQARPRGLARRLDQQWPGVAASLPEGLDEILTVVRLRLPKELRRSLACTNIAENMMGTVRRVTRNVKRWRDARMALRWVAAGMLEATKGFRRLKAHRQTAGPARSPPDPPSPRRRKARCSRHQGRLTFNPAPPSRRSSTLNGTSPLSLPLQAGGVHIRPHVTSPWRASPMSSRDCRPHKRIGIEAGARGHAGGPESRRSLAGSCPLCEPLSISEESLSWTADPA